MASILNQTWEFQIKGLTCYHYSIMPIPGFCASAIGKHCISSVLLPQIDTDESLVVASRQVYPYVWRSHKSPQVSDTTPVLHAKNAWPRSNVC